MKKRPFNPEQAKQAKSGGHGVENVGFGIETQGSIFRDLIDLQDLLKGARVEDYDTVFAGLDRVVLERYKHLVDQISMNLKRIIEAKQE